MALLALLAPVVFAQQSGGSSQCAIYSINMTSRVTGQQQVYTGVSASAACQAAVQGGANGDTSTSSSLVSWSASMTNVTESQCSFDATMTITNKSSGAVTTVSRPGEVEAINKTLGPCPCQPNAPVASGYFPIGTSPGARPQMTACNGGCTVFFDGTSPAGSALVDGVKTYFSQGTYYTDGGTCSSSGGGGGDMPTSSASIPASSCGAGQVAGQLNGSTVCAPAAGASAPGSGASAPNSGGSSAGDKQGSESVNKSCTDLPNGDKQCVTSKVTVSPDGTVSRETTTETTKGNGSVTSQKDVTCNGPSCTNGGSGGSSGGGGGLGNGKGLGGTDGGKSQSGGPCVDNPNAKGCAGSPVAVSGLYEKKTRTFGDVLGDFKSGVSRTPVGQVTSSFFQVSASGGACEPWAGTVPYLNAEFSVNVHCSETATKVYPVLRAVVLLVCAILAFRIVFAI